MRDLANRARAIAAGDVAAFEELFRELHPPLCEVVDSYVRSQDTAEEIVQDLFLAVWVKRATLARADSITGYLFAAARNRALQHLRHRAVVARQTERLTRDPELSPTTAPPPDTDSGPAHDDTTSVVRAAIDRLPPRTRLALILQMDHHMPQAQIAAAMGISIKGAEGLLAKAKSKLRADLGPLAARAIPFD